MNEEPRLIYSSKPTLRNPYIVCGLDGWVNVGNVATGGINYFISQFKATRFAEMPISRYHVFQIPGASSVGLIFRMKDGLIVESHFPKNEFYYSQNPTSEHDLIFLLGTEPNLNWEEYADTVVSLASDFGAARLYAFGGLFGEVPYTREPMMSCTCTSAKVKQEMERYNITFSDRQGPPTFNQMLLYACKKKGLEGASFTVRVPYYPEFDLAIGYSPKSIKAVLIRLNHILHLNMNFADLDSSIRELQGKFDSIRQQNPRFNTYVEELEKEYVEMQFNESFDISPSEAIKFAEEFLKNKDQPKE